MSDRERALEQLALLATRRREEEERLIRSEEKMVRRVLARSRATDDAACCHGVGKNEEGAGKSEEGGADRAKDTMVKMSKLSPQKEECMPSEQGLCVIV